MCSFTHESWIIYILMFTVHMFAIGYLRGILDKIVEMYNIKLVGILVK